MIIFEQKWHTSRKEFYRYSGKYVLPVFTGILVKKCATLPIPIPNAPHLGAPPLSRFASFPSKFPLFLTNPESGIISHAAFLTADDGEICTDLGKK